MSRTIKGAKGCGYEWWGTRPMNGYCNTVRTRGKTSITNKQRCHRIERQIQKRELRKELP